EASQNDSKLAEMFDSASSFSALVGIAVDVVNLFMALLSFVESAPRSLSAQGGQRRFSYFNIVRDNSRPCYWLDIDDRTLVMMMVNGIGETLTNDRKKERI